MNFGFNKCNTLNLQAGKRKDYCGEGHVLLSGEEFKYLTEDRQYKYLGINESGMIDHNELKQQMKKEYFRRVKKLSKSYLHSRNLFKAINVYAIPVLLYSFGVLNYKIKDLYDLDVKTRKILALNKVHQQKADIERLYLPIKEGGRGLINIETLYKTQIIKYYRYLKNYSDHLVKAVFNHDNKRDKYSICRDAQKYKLDLKICTEERFSEQELKMAVIKSGIERWQNKPLHGQFYKSVLLRENIDKLTSFQWLKKLPISPILEATIFAIQDQSIVTRQHERDIFKKPIDGKCRLCKIKDETTQHVISGCEKLAGTYYVKRHNNIVQYVFWSLAKKHNLDVHEKWMTHCL